MIVLKTPQYRYADAGFVRVSKTTLNAQVFMLGHAALNLQVNKKICLNNACMTPKAFNARVLNAYYPKDLIVKVFAGTPILNKKNYQKNSHGFTQKIKHEQYEIFYTVYDGTIRFKDNKNSILIKLRKLSPSKGE